MRRLLFPALCLTGALLWGPVGPAQAQVAAPKRPAAPAPKTAPPAAKKAAPVAPAATPKKPAAAAPADKAETVPGEALLPPNVLFFLSMPDVPALKEGFRSSNFGQILADPAFQPFLDDVRAKLSEGSGKLKEEIGLSLEDLWTLPQGEFNVSVLETEEGEIAFVAMVDFGDRREVAEKLIAKMDEALKKNDAEASKEEIEEVDVVTYTLKKEEGDNNPIDEISYFVEDTYFVLSTNKSAIASVLERWDGDHDATFADDEVFAYAMKKCGYGEDDDEPGVKWFVKPTETIQAVANAIQEDVPQAQMAVGFLPVLGLDKLKGMGGTASFGEGDFDAVSKSFIYAEQPTSGILNLFQFPATELSPPKWVRADAAAAVSLNWDLQAAYKAVEEMVDAFQGEGSFARLVDNLAEQGPQIHIKKDVVDQLSGKMHIVSYPTAGEVKEIPEFLFALEVKDAAAVRKLLAKVAKEGTPAETRQFQNETIYEMEAGESKGGVAVTGNVLAASNQVKLIEGIIREPAASKTLADSPEYRRMAKHFPKKTSAISFSHQTEQYRAMYEKVRSGEGAEDAAEKGIDVKKLPPYEKLEKYLQSTAGYSTTDEKGSLSVSFSLKKND